MYSTAVSNGYWQMANDLSYITDNQIYEIHGMFLFCNLLENILNLNIF